MASEEVIVKMDSVELGVEEEEEAPDAETSPRANPCEMINGLVQPDSAAMALVARLSDAAAKVLKSGFLAAQPCPRSKTVGSECQGD